MRRRDGYPGLRRTPGQESLCSRAGSPKENLIGLYARLERSHREIELGGRDPSACREPEEQIAEGVDLCRRSRLPDCGKEHLTTLLARVQSYQARLQLVDDIAFTAAPTPVTKGSPGGHALLPHFRAFTPVACPSPNGTAPPAQRADQCVC